MANRDWGIATMDDGIWATAPSRREALKLAGFATLYTRRAVGPHCYEYTSAEGSRVTIGPVRELDRMGFESDADEVYRLCGAAAQEDTT